MALRYDGITIYGQDIQRRRIKTAPIAYDKYLSLLTKSKTNETHFVVGQKSETRLPDNFFDRIIILETFHHFENQNEMLADIYKKLKQNGRLYVYEPKVSARIYNEGCKAYLLPKEEIIESLKGNGFQFETAIELRGNPGNAPPWYAVPESQVEDKIILEFRKL